MALGLAAVVSLVLANVVLETPSPKRLGRRHAVEVVASVALSAGMGSTLAWLEGPTGRLGVRAPVRTDGLDELRSINELADLAREQGAETLRKVHGTRSTRADARAAAVRLLACAASLDRAMELAEARRWADLSQLAQDVRDEVERSVAVIMASDELPVAARSEVGWEWGHCGWRRCGIQADIVQTLCKLREGIGLFVPAEARLYIDVARRGVDELLRLLAENRLLTSREVVGLNDPSRYLSKDDLDAVLGEDSAPNGVEWEV
jgi:hypothetical protein